MAEVETGMMENGDDGGVFTLVNVDANCKSERREWRVATRID
jgi:hypothetical protein